MSTIQREPEQIVLAELDAGERLLWAGRPSGGIVFRRADAFMVPFSVMWAGFAVVFEVTAYRQGGLNFMALWGIPFVLIGAYLVIGRFIWDAWRRAQTFYGVTNQRVIIVSSLMSKKVKSLNLRTLSDLSLDEKRTAKGSISFGGSSMTFSCRFSMRTMEISVALRPQRRKTAGRFGNYCASTACWPAREAVEPRSYDAAVPGEPTVRIAIGPAKVLSQHGRNCPHLVRKCFNESASPFRPNDRTNLSSSEMSPNRISVAFPSTIESC